MPHPDQKYIDALVNNDESLIDELYSKFSEKIKCMILKNHGTENDAADIFQEALLSLFYKAKTESFTLTCSLGTFLFLVCKNKWLNELSKRKTSRVTIEDLNGFTITGEDDFKLAEDHLLQEARKNLLKDKLALLCESCRQLLHLSWSGKSMVEVACTLHVSYGYARKKKSECMAKLVSLVKQSSEFASLKW